MKRLLSFGLALVLVLSLPAAAVAAAEARLLRAYRTHRQTKGWKSWVTM